jgi:hypothetical protein
VVAFTSVAPDMSGKTQQELAHTSAIFATVTITTWIINNTSAPFGYLVLLSHLDMVCFFSNTYFFLDE